MKNPKLENAMTKSLVSVRWNLPMAEACKLMEERRLRHLPVMGEDGSLVGILSDRDVKRAMDPRFPAFSQDCLVGDSMSWPVLSVPEEAPILEVVDSMLNRKVSAILVTKGDVPSGIVTSDDLLRVLRDLLLEQGGGRRLRLLDPRYSPYVQEILHEVGSAGI
jgi:CBS domain-containing protein